MKRFLCALSLALLATGPALAQQVVFDPAVVSTLVVNHTAQQAALQDIKEKEGRIAALQATISVKMTQIKALEEKMYRSLTSVQSIIGQSKNIVYASQIAADIGRYQGQMMELARGDKELLVIAAKTELALLQRTSDLFTYIYQVAIIGTDVNLMNNADRLALIRHVVDELRVMRGLAYSITRKMRLARHAGLLRTMNPLGLAYPDNSRAIIRTLMDEFETLKR
ncbi:plasmid transfer protein [Pontibacter mangrovi]|uniref:Plasmid transfer protein n=1 Tax=Pontibacter mangrovi TaxID=2589816 RepID=A0A501VV82_9BACT|nr:plasmid transfer protein [Pontibacter mangrovi]TPE39714.1 plasmid transfer protein [Pontibacter mangrovi]